MAKHAAANRRPSLTHSRRHSPFGDAAPHGRHRACPVSSGASLCAKRPTHAGLVPELEHLTHSEPVSGTKAPAHTTGPDRNARAKMPVVVGLTAAMLLASGGGIAYAGAHKTVAIDVDGQTRQVETLAGSVADVLAAEGIAVNDQDLVTPALSSKVTEGVEITVRYAAELTFAAGENEASTTLPVLDAVEALDKLSGRVDDVALLASRTEDRVDIGVQLNQGAPVLVVADGHVDVLTRGARTVDSALQSAGITLGAEDTVTVVPAADITTATDTGADVAVVVARVATTQQSAEVELPYAEVEQADANRYEDESELLQAGVPGKRVIVAEVVTVDGVETSRTIVSDDVVLEPVDEVTVVGTKERPVAAAQGSAPAGVWASLAQCESGGNPAAVSANGMYHGLYQFSVATWQMVGGSGLPSQASAAEQTNRAQILQSQYGWGQWPACAAKLGLL